MQRLAGCHDKISFAIHEGHVRMVMVAAACSTAITVILLIVIFLIMLIYRFKLLHTIANQTFRAISKCSASEIHRQKYHN